jgi:hypothetical protein
MRNGALGLSAAWLTPMVLKRTAGVFRQAGVVLPTVAQLKNPATIPAPIQEKLRTVEPDASDSLNLFRRALVQRRQPQGPCRYSGFCRVPEQLTGGEGTSLCSAR